MCKRHHGIKYDVHIAMSDRWSASKDGQQYRRWGMTMDGEGLNEDTVWALGKGFIA